MNSDEGEFESLFSNGPLQNYQNLSDAILMTKDNGVFPVHKIVLATQSEFFRAMFDFDMNQKEFVLPIMQRRILENILAFIYKNQLDVNHADIPDLLMASDFLSMERLWKKCCSHALTSLDIHTSLPLLDVAWKLHKTHLFECCYRFVQLNFQSIMENSAHEIPPLDLELLKLVLADKNLNISSENTLWQTILFWVEHDLKERSRNVPELLTYLDMENIDESVASSIINNTIVSQNEFCNAINELKTGDFLYFDILATHMQLHSNPVFSPAQASHPSCMNTVVGFCGYSKDCDECQIEVFETFDEKFDVCRKICDLDTFPYRSAIIDHKLYLLGCETVFSWDLVHNVELTRRGRITSRLKQYPHSATLENGTIYFIQSKASPNRNNRVERFVPEINRWDIVAGMPHMEVRSTLCCGDKIYVFGNFRNPTRFFPVRVQIYDPETNTWSDVSSPRSGLMCAPSVYKNKIFVNDELFVEEYDPMTNSWSLKPKLPYFYSEPNFIVLDDILYIYEQAHFEERAPLFWDEEEYAWKTVPRPSILYNLKRLIIIPINNSETARLITLNRRNSVQKWMKSPFSLKCFLHGTLNLSQFLNK